MALYLLLLPFISKALTKKYSMAPPIIDLWLARGSSLFGVIGPILLGLASGPVVLLLCTFSPFLFTYSLLMANSTCSFYLFIGIPVLHPVIRDIVGPAS